MSTISPKSNIYKSSDHFQVDVFLPGVSEEHLEIDIENHTLKIRAFRQRGETRLTYKRDFRLNRTIDVDSIEAKLANGRLQITLPIANHSRKVLINA
ncbi:MAG: Hsp20/alpha crystallin family protein [Myxococcota bacterium]|nr:Hsp20/alpha crystallin family protein [Myxococcota bacterium]